jgi:hypothetical protein
MGIACLAKVFLVAWTTGIHPQTLELKSANLLTINPKYTPTASAYAVAPVPPWDSGRVSRK